MRCGEGEEDVLRFPLTTVLHLQGSFEMGGEIDNLFIENNGLMQ